MIFVPAVTIIKLMHSVTNLDRRNRLTQLVAQVSQRQKARLAKTSSPEDESYEVPDYERILAPPSQDQIKSLAAMHAMAIEQVRDWMSYRVILNAHAWLGKRVGDATIREDCLVFAVFQSDFEMEGKNSLGLWGRPGMVAMRASALAEKFGPDWASRFPQAGSVWIAQNKEDYENLLRGIRDTASDDMSDQSFGPT